MHSVSAGWVYFSIRTAKLLLVAIGVAVGVGAGVALAGVTELRRPVEAGAFVTNAADANMDFRVDQRDLQIVSSHLGSDTSSRDANAAFSLGDVNLDDRIDVVDLALVATNFGG